MELAVLLSFLVIGLYCYGFIESMRALPDVPTGRILGTPLNLAKLTPDTAGTASVADSIAAARAGAASTDTQPQQAAAAAVDGTGSTEEDHVPHLRRPEQPEQGKEQHSDVAAVPIPEGKWPVSLREEKDDYETLVHVGDNKTIMKVPKFWSPPLHNKQLFTRDQAMKVGTCIEPDPVTGSMVRGDACPPDKRTIYIGLASYRDYQCRYTLESAFLRAAHPERIRVGTWYRCLYRFLLSENMEIDQSDQ
jgi:hypothetical protein